MSRNHRANRHRSARDAPLPAGVRLQRVLADAGVASRRACEALIEARRVEVNGRVVSGLPAFVDPGSDRITVDGRPIRSGSGGTFGGAGRPLYIMLNKPPRTVTTARDEYGRRTVLDLVDHPAKARLFPVGRLDFDTSGLLLLTNDGNLAHRLTHARFGVTRTYLVDVKARQNLRDPASTPAPESAEALPTGAADMARLEREAVKAGRKAGRHLGPDAHLSRVQIRELPTRPGAPSGRRTLEVTLAEGRNRQVATVLARAGYAVKGMSCIGMGPIRLRGVAPGAWRELDRGEIKALRRAAGLADESSGPRARPAKEPTGVGP